MRRRRRISQGFPPGSPTPCEGCFPRYLIYEMKITTCIYTSCFLSLPLALSLCLSLSSRVSSRISCSSLRAECCFCSMFPRYSFLSLLMVIMEECRVILACGKRTGERQKKKCRKGEQESRERERGNLSFYIPILTGQNKREKRTSISLNDKILIMILSPQQESRFSAALLKRQILIDRRRQIVIARCNLFH